jgi:hypothetical protein
MMGRLEQGLGILLVLIILLDIFLTVLYARIGTSIIGSRVEQLPRVREVTANDLDDLRTSWRPAGRFHGWKLPF